MSEDDKKIVKNYLNNAKKLVLDGSDQRLIPFLEYKEYKKNPEKWEELFCRNPYKLIVQLDPNNIIRVTKNRDSEDKFRVDYKGQTFSAIFKMGGRGEKEYIYWYINFPAEMSKKDRDTVKDYLYTAKSVVGGGLNWPPIPFQEYMKYIKNPEKWDHFYYQQCSCRVIGKTDPETQIWVKKGSSRVSKYKFDIEYGSMIFKAIFERGRGSCFEEFYEWKINFPAKMPEKWKKAIEDYLYDFMEDCIYFTNEGSYKAYRSKTITINDFKLEEYKDVVNQNFA